MTRRCAIYGCRSGTTAFRFPMDCDVRQQWIDFVKTTRLGSFHFRDSYGVCGRHFTCDSFENDFIRKLKEQVGYSRMIKLKKGAIPTLAYGTPLAEIIPTANVEPLAKKIPTAVEPLVKKIPTANVEPLAKKIPTVHDKPPANNKPTVCVDPPAKKIPSVHGEPPAKKIPTVYGEQPTKHVHTIYVEPPAKKILHNTQSLVPIPCIFAPKTLPSRFNIPNPPPSVTPKRSVTPERHHQWPASKKSKVSARVTPIQCSSSNVATQVREEQIDWNVIQSRRDTVMVYVFPPFTVQMCVEDANNNVDNLHHDEELEPLDPTLPEVKLEIDVAEEVPSSWLADSHTHHHYQGDRGTVCRDNERISAHETVVKFEVKAEPGAEFEVKTESDADVEVKTKPGAEFEVKTEPGADVDVKTEPGADVDVKTEPGADVDVKTEPGADEVKTKPDTDVEVKTEPDTEFEVKIEPDAEVEVKTNPDAEFEVKIEPDSDFEEKTETFVGTRSSLSKMPKVCLKVKTEKTVGTCTCNLPSVKEGTDVDMHNLSGEVKTELEDLLNGCLR